VGVDIIIIIIVKNAYTQTNSFLPISQPFNPPSFHNNNILNLLKNVSYFMLLGFELCLTFGLEWILLEPTNSSLYQLIHFFQHLNHLTPPSFHNNNIL